MHNWRLLVLLILSLFHPILSNQGLFDGRQCSGVPTTLSVTERESWNGNYRSGKAIPGTHRISDDRLNNHRYEARNAERERTRFSDERQLDRTVIARDDRSRSIYDKRLYETVRDVSRSFRSPTAHEQKLNNIELKNGKAVGSEEFSGSRLNTLDMNIRKFKNNDLNRQVLEETLNSIQSRRSINQRDRTTRANKRDVRQITTNAADGNIRSQYRLNIYFRNENRDRDNAQERDSVLTRDYIRQRDERIQNEHITLSLGRKSSERNVRQNEASRMSARKTNVGHERTDSRNVDSYLRENKRTISIERLNPLENNHLRDIQLVRNYDNNVRRERIEERYSERHERRNIHETDVIAKRHVRQSYERTDTDNSFEYRHAEQNMIVKDYRRESRNNERHERDNMAESRRSDMRRVMARQVREERSERNSDKYTRDDTRIRKTINNSPIRYEDTYDFRSQRDNNRHSTIRVKRELRGDSESRTLAYKSIRVIRSQRATSLERETSILNARRIMTRPIAPMQQELHANERDERIDHKHVGRNERDGTQKQTAFLKTDLRETDERRMTVSRRISSRDLSKRDVSTNVNHYESYSRSNNDERTDYESQVLKNNARRSSNDRSSRNRIDIERDSRAYMLSRRLERNVRSSSGRISLNDLRVLSREERNSRDENTKVRKTERHIRDTNRERAVSVRDRILEDSSRQLNERFTLSDENRNRIVLENQNDNRNKDIRINRRYTHERTVSMNNVRQTRERIIDEHISRNHKDQNKLARGEVKNYRYARNTRVKDIPIERALIKETRNIAHERNDRYLNARDERDTKTREIREYTQERLERELRQHRTDDRTYSQTNNAKRITRDLESQTYRPEENSRIRNSKESKLRSMSDLNRKIEGNMQRIYSFRRQMDMERDTSRRNTEFALELRTDKVNELTDNSYSTSSYWTHLFYAFQGIYICGVFIQIFRRKEINDKASTMRWLNPARHVKVD